MTLRTVLLAFGVAAAVALPRLATAQLIVPDQQYRCPAVDPQCKSSIRKLRAFEQHDGFTINFVEIKDNGDFWDRRQLDEALAQIEKTRDGGRQKPIVFVYIHGWQNNADELRNDVGETDCLKLNGDVAKFRTCGVARLAARPGIGGSRPIVGIYLAWRGLSSSIEPFKHLFSYWPRRNKARLVGRKGMFEALEAVVEKVGEHRDDYMLMMVGHSFGARVLEYAAEAVDPGRGHCGFMARFRQRFLVTPQSSDCASATASNASAAASNKAPVDLFVYVNAATSHRMTYKVFDDWNTTCGVQPANPVCPADPMYLATSSRTDYATSFLLPVANFIAPAFRADRLHLISAANTPWLHTHDDPKKVTVCPALSPGSFCFDAPEDDHRQNGPLVTYYARAHDSRPQTRVWIFNTGHRLIRNHGDVWNRRVFNMVIEVLDRELAAKADGADAASDRLGQTRLPEVTMALRSKP